VFGLGRVFLEKLTIAYLVRNRLHFFGSRKFIAMFKTTQMFFLFWTKCFHSISFPAIY